MSWFVLIKFNTRVQKRNAAHFVTNGNTLLSIRVLSKDYYEILKKLIQKLNLVHQPDTTENKNDE